MKACDQEFRMSRPSYSYQTLQTFSREFPGLQFSLIMGGDNLRNFHLWKDYEKILALFPVLVYPRPGETVPVLQGVNITLVDAPLTSVSSTEIRDKVKIGKDVAGEMSEDFSKLTEDEKKIFAVLELSYGTLKNYNCKYKKIEMI